MNFETKLRHIQQPYIALESLFIKLASMDSCLVVRDVLSGNVEVDSQNLEPIKLIEQSKTIIQEDSEIRGDLSDNINNAKFESVSIKVTPEVSEKKEDDGLDIKLNLQTIIDNWSEVIVETEKINSKISNLLEEIKLESFFKGVLSIFLKRDQIFHAKSIQKDTGKIEAVLKEVYGSTIRLNIKIEKKIISQKDAEEKVNEGDTEHPLFMKVLETFEGEIIR